MDECPHPNHHPRFDPRQCFAIVPPSRSSSTHPPRPPSTSMPQEIHIPLAEYVSLTSRQSSNWSFTQGLLLGQLSVILFIVFFIKFFIFGSPTPAAATHSRSRRRSSTYLKGSRNPGLRKKASQILRPPPPLSTSTILNKTLYNVHSHQPESLDWFNVLIAQTIEQFREDARTDNAILTSLNKLLNGPARPDFVDTINVTEIQLGEDFPIFSNCRISPTGDGPEPGRLQAQMDVDLNDLITLGVETKLLVNWPRPVVAVLPVALAVSIVRFSGTLSISFVPSEENSTGSTTLSFSFLDDYRLDISVRSLLGSRSKLQDIPKIAQLVESRLYAWIDERCVEPKFQQIVLPSLWPRKKTTREQARSGDEDTNGSPGQPGEGGSMRRRATISAH